MIVPVVNGITNNNGLLTTAVTNPLVVSMSAPQSTPSSFSVNGDKEDNTTLDAELMALAAQQMRSPSGSHSQTPTQQLKLDPKNNPAKWSVRFKHFICSYSRIKF